MSILDNKLKSRRYRKDYRREALILALTEVFEGERQRQRVPTWRVARRLGMTAAKFRRFCLDGRPERVTVALIADAFGALDVELGDPPIKRNAAAPSQADRGEK